MREHIEDKELEKAVEDEFLRLANLYGQKAGVDALVLNTRNKRSVRSIKKSIERDRRSNDVVRQEEVTKYKYTGPSPQRDFCRKMIALNKYYTLGEINQMSFRGDNKKLGHKGQNYSIAKYKGGKNCRHFWTEYQVLTPIKQDGSRGREIIRNMGKATGLMGEVASASNNYWAHPSNS